MATHHKEFNPNEQLPDDFLMVIYGARRSGKSTLLVDILMKMKEKLKNHKVFLFSGTSEVDPDQYNFIPDAYKYEDISTLQADLGDIVDDQKTKITGKGEERKKNVESNKVLIIMDDCVNSEAMRHTERLNYLAVAGRHIAMSVIILSQVVCGSGSIPPIVRTQADVVIMACCPRPVAERELLSEFYLQATGKKGNANKGTSMSLLENLTSVRYRAMVVSMENTSARKTQDYVYHYGPVTYPQETEGFKLGTPDQWKDVGDGDDEQKGPEMHTMTYGKNRPDTEEEKKEHATHPSLEFNGGEQEYNGDETVGGGNDVNGGTGTRHKGISLAAREGRQMITGAFRLQHQPDDEHLPIGLGTHNKNKTLRNFIHYAYQGGLNNTQYEGYNRSAGWTSEKPDSRSARDIIKQLSPRSKRAIHKWMGLSNKRKRA